jgi:hypothetical protein
MDFGAIGSELFGLKPGEEGVFRLNAGEEDSLTFIVLIVLVI